MKYVIFFFQVESLANIEETTDQVIMCYTIIIILSLLVSLIR